jgi:hypothetical protein
MDVNVRYIVTKESENEEFIVGDHIKLNPDGSITCYEAMGWIEAEDVPAAIVGMEYKVDKNYMYMKVEKLWREIRRIDKAILEDIQ